MFQLHYTCEVICADGKLHWLRQFGYFRTKEIFRQMLELWSGADGPNGGTYQYWQQPDDWRLNAEQQPLPSNFRFSGFFTLHMEPFVFHHNHIHAQPGSIWGEL